MRFFTVVSLGILLFFLACGMRSANLKTKQNKKQTYLLKKYSNQPQLKDRIIYWNEITHEASLKKSPSEIGFAR